MQIKNNLSRLHALWVTLGWLAGLAIIFIVWAILAATVYKNQPNHGVNIGACFSAVGTILAKGNNWMALIIAWSQALSCFVGSLILAMCLIILSKYWKPIHYIMLPFVTLARSLPTAVLMALISIFLITVLPLVPITVAFFIIFPMMFAGFEKAINNINKDSIDVAKVFHISKWNQVRYIYLPQALPYIFSTFVAAFGLTFKIALASQMVQTWVTTPPNYPSAGMYIAQAMKQQQFPTVVAWGMIAIAISLIMELIIIEIGRPCMPNKYKDRTMIKNFFLKLRRK